jgi:general secretion pathway protein C
MLTQTWSGTHLVAAMISLAPTSLDPTPIANPTTAPTCEDVELRVVTESTDPAFSLATLVTASDPSPRQRRAGDGIGKLRLEFIGYNERRQSPAAWFSTANSLCQALLFEPPRKRPEPAEAETPSARLPPRASLRAVPEVLHGTVVGVRLFGVRKDGLLGALGIENGDRIDAVNGVDMTKPENALRVYATLRTTSHFRVELSRRGRPMTIDYHVR